jgi:hypothetical protein
MEDRLDQLFREKLANHRLTPTENAWQQIHHQLAAKRRKIWAKRLAMAASILLFLTAGYIAFQYSKQLDTKSPIVTQHDNAEKAATPHNTEKQETKEENTPAIAELKETTIGTDNTGTKAKNNTLDGKEAHPASNTASFLANKEAVKTPVRKTDEAVKEEPSLPEPVIEELPASQIETLLAINSGEAKIESEVPLYNENDSRTDKSPDIAKDYPSITVIYKANQNSELLAKKETGVLNKGIKKISRFSDEHIVTEEVKTMLRNTKDDLLALNFGKIINRSN